MKIEVHSKDGCPYCEATETYLNKHGIPYTTIKHNDVEERNAKYDEWGLEGNKRTVPQIFVDGERIGGYNDLVHSDVLDRFNAGNFDADF